jgi:nitric oxide synthase oxygenase domain/subunit
VEVPERLFAEYDLRQVCDRGAKAMDFSSKTKHRHLHRDRALVELAVHLLIWTHLQRIIVPPGTDKADQGPSEAQ